MMLPIVGQLDSPLQLDNFIRAQDSAHLHCSSTTSLLILLPPLSLSLFLLHCDMSFCMCSAYHLFMRFIIVVILCFSLFCWQPRQAEVAGIQSQSQSRMSGTARTEVRLRSRGSGRGVAGGKCCPKTDWAASAA